MALLGKYGMPCDDFILKRPQPNLMGFQDRPASYADALHAQRFLMVTKCNMTPEEACEYTEHSWRHVMITAARQMPKPLSSSEQNEIGHWVENSGMPRT